MNEVVLSGFTQRRINRNREKYLIIYLRICKFEKEDNVINSKG